MSEGKSMVDEMAEKMIEKLNITGHSREELRESSIHGTEDAINFYSSRGRGGARNRDGGNRGRFTRNTEIRNYTTKQRRCRACQSTDHLLRSCPNRCCQACGKRGHDAWDKNCPNYQL